MLENKIIIRSVFKITRCTMEPARNPANNRFGDTVRPVNANGEMLLTDDERNDRKRHFIAETDSIEIYDGKSFDLDDEYDRAWWEAIKYSKKIAQDRGERDKSGKLIVDGNAKRYGTAEFYVERPGFESKAKNDRKREIHEAKAFIYQDVPEALYQKVRLLGNPMFGSTQSDVEDYLVNLAEQKPQLITELYTGSDTHLRLFLLDAVDKRVIYNRDKLFFFGDSIILGATDSAVISYFKNPDNKRVVDLIKRETYPDLFTNEEVDLYTGEAFDELSVTPPHPVKAQSVQPNVAKKVTK